MTGNHHRVCLHGGHLWPGEGATFLEGGLMLRGGTVEAVLTPADLPAAAAAADEAVWLPGTLLMPPFFSGHVHSSATLFRGTENSLPLELWSYHAINYGRGFDERTVRAAVLLTAAEMIRNGIGGYTDHFPQSRLGAAAVAAHAESGLRVAFAPFFADLLDEDLLHIPLDRAVLARLSPLAPRNVGEMRASLLALHAAVARHGDGRLAFLLGPNAPQRCSDAAWDMWTDLRERLGVGSHTHLLETLPQRLHSDRRWPGGLVAALADRDLLDARSSVAHGVWLDGRDRELLAQNGVVLSHNPYSNQVLGSGRMDVRAALDAGVTVALGTDSANTGGRHDLWEAMRHMLVAGRDPGSDPARWVRPGEALDAATTGVRTAFPECGHLTAGAPADVLMVRMDAGVMAAAPVSPATLTTHGDGRAVQGLMVAGRWLLRDGRIEAFDEAAVVAEAADCAAALRNAARPNEAALAGLTRPYMAWSDRVFAGARCPGCGSSGLHCE